MNNIQQIWEKNTGLFLIISICISILFLIIVLRSIDLEEVLSTLLHANYLFLIPAVGFIVLSFLLRSYRWKYLFEDQEKLKIQSLFEATMIGYLGNNILPARTGEIIRAFFFGKKESVPKSTVLATIAVERVLDFLVLILLFSLVFLIYPFPQWLEKAGLFAGILAIVSFCVLIGIIIKGRSFLALLLRAFSFLPGKYITFIESKGHLFINGFQSLKKWHNFYRFLGLTLVIWIVEIAIMYTFMIMFNISIPLLGTLFVILSIGIGTMIPSSPGYIGTYEFFTINALALFGVPGGISIPFAFLTHAIIFLGTSILGVTCIFSSGFFKFTKNGYI